MRQACKQFRVGVAAQSPLTVYQCMFWDGSLGLLGFLSTFSDLLAPLLALLPWGGPSPEVTSLPFPSHMSLTPSLHLAQTSPLQNICSSLPLASFPSSLKGDSC